MMGSAFGLSDGPFRSRGFLLCLVFLEEERLVVAHFLRLYILLKVKGIEMADEQPFITPVRAGLMYLSSLDAMKPRVIA